MSGVASAARGAATPASPIARSAKHPRRRLRLVARRQRLGGRGAHVGGRVAQPLEERRRRARVVDGAERLDGAPAHVGSAMPRVERQRVDRRLVGPQRARLAQLAERVEHRQQPRRRRARGQHLEERLGRGGRPRGAQRPGRLDRCRVVAADHRQPQRLQPVGRKPGRRGRALGGGLGLGLVRGARRVLGLRRACPRATARRHHQREEESRAFQRQDRLTALTWPCVSASENSTLPL